MGMNNEKYLKVERCTEVKHGLHSLLFELARCTKTSGCHYSVLDDGSIAHHNGMWRVVILPPLILILSDRSLMISDNGKMLLIDDYSYEEVECITAPGYLSDYGNLYEDGASLLRRIVEAYYRYVRYKFRYK